MRMTKPHGNIVRWNAWNAYQYKKVQLKYLRSSPAAIVLYNNYK